MRQCHRPSGVGASLGGTNVINVSREALDCNARQDFAESRALLPARGESE